MTKCLWLVLAACTASPPGATIDRPEKTYDFAPRVLPTTPKAQLRAAIDTLAPRLVRCGAVGAFDVTLRVVEGAVESTDVNGLAPTTAACVQRAFAELTIAIDDEAAIVVHAPLTIEAHS